MWESMSDTPGFSGMMLFWGMAFTTIVATYGMKTWRKHQAAKMENELKMEMISRGMSAEDIERVLAAKSAEPQKLAETQAYAKR